VLASIEHFFKIYKELEGKKTERAGGRRLRRQTAIHKLSEKIFQTRAKPPCR